jgi:hypothetical protein
VAPEQFYLTTSTGNRYFAIDPEKQLFSMEARENVREANAKNAAVLAGVVAVAAVTAAVVSEVNDNKNNHNTNNNSNNENRNNNNNNNNNNNTNLFLSLPLVLNSTTASETVVESRVSDFQPDLPTTGNRNFWMDYTLRKTTLAPGEKVRGKVLFPRQDALRDFLLMVPVEQTVFSFGFKQKVFIPN